MNDEPPNRITVSRDALRADLAEMELRLRVYFDEQLRHKADQGPFQELALKVDKMDRGDFTQVHRRALVALISDETKARVDQEWTTKQRVLGLVSAFVAVLALGLSIYVGTTSAGNIQSPSVPTLEEKP